MKDLKTDPETMNLQLDDDDWETQLCRAVSEIPEEKAPPRLRRRLRRIPRQQRALERPGFFIPRWAAALAVMPLVLASYLYWDNIHQAREIAQGRQDLAVALAYLDKANQKASVQIMATIDGGLNRPVTNNTIQTLQQSLDITLEYEL